MKPSHLTWAALSILLGAGVAAERQAGRTGASGLEKNNMELVGHQDLQARSA